MSLLSHSRDTLSANEAFPGGEWAPDAWADRAHELNGDMPTLPPAVAAPAPSMDERIRVLDEVVAESHIGIPPEHIARILAQEDLARARDQMAADEHARSERMQELKRQYGGDELAAIQAWNEEVYGRPDLAEGGYRSYQFKQRQ